MFFLDTVKQLRRWVLERKLADAEVSEEEQHNLLKYLEKKETEYMRLQRHKMGVDDFDLLTIIGRGAFGEVCLCFFCQSCNLYPPTLFSSFVFKINSIRHENSVPPKPCDVNWLNKLFSSIAIYD